MRLEDQFTAAMLAAGNKRSSIKCYWRHVVGFIRFTSERHGSWLHPGETKIEDVYAWRRHLAKDINLSPKTQNQAVSAIKFLFARVLGKPLAEPEENPLRAKEPNRCRRRVIARPDLISLFNAFRPADRIVPQLMYASVLRLSDTLNLRIEDLNFADEQIEIASTKHDHFRIVPFPKSIHDKVRCQVEIAERFHRDDSINNPNGVPVPHAYARKCPSAPRDFRWMWLFPSATLSRDPADGRLKRYHCDDDNQRRIFRDAVQRSGVRRRITPHDIRRAAATHLHLSGMPLRRLQAILGHNSLEMTQLYILEDEAQINGSHSPFDLLNGLQ
jgi:site-specific recombinase XerD